MRVPGLERAKRLRVVRPLIRPLSRVHHVLRRAGQAKVILASGVFDVEWYEAQCGESFASSASAVAHYLRAPRQLGYSPHPLFEAATFDPQWSTRADDPFAAYLGSPQQWGRTAPHPMFDVELAESQLERCDVGADRRGEHGPWLSWVRAASPEWPMPWPGPGPAPAWGAVRERVLLAAVEWRRRSRQVDRLRPIPKSSRPHPGTAAPPENGAIGLAGPRVSVVVATWNRARSLRAAVASIQAQTFGDLEVIVVDDGSDDDTPAVLAGLAHFDSRIRCLRQDRAGVCRARNLGLRAARGDYVAFLDSDNTWEPDFLAVMIATMSAKGWTVAHAALEVRHGDGTSYRGAEGVRESLLLGNYVDLNVLVAQRRLVVEIGGFDESLRRAVDYDLVLRLSTRSDIHLVPIVGAIYSEDRSDHTRISTREPATWNHKVRGRHLIDWSEVRSRSRRTGRISVIVPVARRLDKMITFLELVRPDTSADASRLDVELVLVGTSNRSQYCVLTACITGLPATVIQHSPGDKMALLTNLGAAASTGEYVVLVRPNASLERAALGPLVEALADPAVGVAQALAERADMTVASAGAAFGPTGVCPQPFLEGFPVSDALRVGDCDLPAALGPALAMRASDFIDVGGLDPLYGNSLADTDLSLRVRERGLGVTRLVTSSRVTVRSQREAGFPHDMAQSARILAERWRTVPSGSSDLWARAGFDVGAFRPVELSGTGQRHEVTWALRPQLHRVSIAVAEGVPVLRWTIDIAAPAGPRGAWWGDRHFATALARSLESRGQQVAVDHREARQRPTRIHDDVLLVLRGLDEVHPPPGPTSLLWILSHPEQVFPWEIARYDAAFAASDTWASDRSARWGLDIRPLLQCTDPALFHPDRAPVDSGPAMLFVGNSRRQFRPLVRLALAVGGEGDLAVFGRGWDEVLGPRVLRGEFVPNEELGALYAAAGFVLNDHWDDMRTAGFLSNRLFDAVASGARVVSDDVPGLTATFGRSVVVVRDQADLARIVQQPYRRHFPDQDERSQQARRLHELHSFAARSDVLIDRVLQLRARDRAVGPGRRDPQGTLRRW